MIKALKKYGQEEPQLYIDALTYFASSPKILEEAGGEMDAVLQKIDRDGLMAPLQVIQAFSNNSVVTMGMINKYLSDNIERERKEISNVSPPPLFSSGEFSALTRCIAEPPLDSQLFKRNGIQKAADGRARFQTDCLSGTSLLILWR